MKKIVVLLLTLGLSLSLAGCGETDPTTTKQDLVRVPQDVKTIAAATKMVKAGGMILVSPGTYKETVNLNTKDVTLRGTDRNKVVLDGEGMRSNGVMGTASGLTVENLTVQNYLLNGVIMTGVTDSKGNGLGRGSDGYTPVDPEKFPPVPGFAIRYVTAINNGLYGLYAFNRTSGVIEKSYASGSADSGIYVGQCDPCNTIIDDNVLEGNAVGIETANASAPITLTRNVANNNRMGALILSNYQETFVPLKGSIIAGNDFSDNNNPNTPAQATGGFGIGVALTATQDVTLTNNRITGNSIAGLWVSSNVDLAPIGNKSVDDLFANNGYNLVYDPRDAAPGDNCFEGIENVWPKLPMSELCKPGFFTKSKFVSTVQVPRGQPFLDLPHPPAQETMPGNPATLPHPPARGKAAPKISEISVPKATGGK